MPEPPPYPGTPRWVKVSGIIALGLLLLIAIIMLVGIGGPHGPGRHLPSGESAGVLEGPARSDGEQPSDDGAR